VPSTEETMIRVILDNVLPRWPDAPLISEALAGVLAPSLTWASSLAKRVMRASVPFDTLLRTALGIERSLTGEALATEAAERLLTLVQGVTAPMAAISFPRVSAAAFSVRPPGGGSGFQPPESWTERAVTEAIKKLGRVARVDLQTLTTRLELAAIISAAALGPGIRGGFGETLRCQASRAGGHVHRVLEERYRKEYAPPHLVVTDRLVYGGSPAAYNGEQLSGVYERDFRLACVYTAWIDPNYGGKRQWTSAFRGDITDFDGMAQWEVKPIGDAVAGVLQETWYRLAYNAVADTWARENPQLAGRLGFLLPGGTWSHSLLMPPIDVTKDFGFAAVAVPMTVPDLSGLILYTVFSGPQMIDVTVMALSIYFWFREQIRRRGQQLGELARQTEQVLREKCRVIAEVLMPLLVILAILLLLAAAIIAAGAIAGTSPIWASILAGATVILLVVGRLGGSRDTPPGRGPPQGAGSLITVNFPGVSVTLNRQDLGTLLSGAEVVYSGSVAAIGRALRPPVVV
jgi:hypothetical protein